MPSLLRCTLAVVALAAPACADEGDPTPVEIPEAVQRAFDASCVADGCHDAASRAEGLSLEATDSVRIVGGTSRQSELPLVQVGDLGGSYLAIKLLPDAQLPVGAVRFEDRMPRDGLEPDDVEHVNTVLAWIAGYGPSGSEGGELTSTGPTMVGSSGGTGDGSGSSTTGSDPTDPGPTTNTGGGPSHPACSVETVTGGVVSEPLDKGDEAGKIPLLVGTILEERCGCHTLADRTLNVEYPALLPPVETLLLDYGDLSRPVGGTTLGELMEEAVLVTLSMPPGSCPAIPEDDRAVLEQWFLDGRPDGA
jgi:hypothetical protein